MPSSPSAADVSHYPIAASPSPLSPPSPFPTVTEEYRAAAAYQASRLFKVVETSYMCALQLVSWDSGLVVPLKTTLMRDWTKDLLVKRPLKFKQLRLRR
ncbi:hypothetical protein Scep_017306 [Stephania cephalantha]|uniref:Uncharacterized protein n=1 Tax=Stephania cephalantha TaxID=152367 RepID=A0AAP0NU46_9MAGN